VCYIVDIDNTQKVFEKSRKSILNKDGIFPPFYLISILGIYIGVNDRIRFYMHLVLELE